MKEQLVSYLTALMAFQKGFDWPCYACYLDKKLEYWFAGNTIEAQCIGIEDIMEELGPNNDYAPRAPTQSLLQKWLREMYNIHILVEFSEVVNEEYGNRYWPQVYKTTGDKVRIALDQLNKENDEYMLYLSYEEALEVGLQKALKLIEL